ncbi:MAG: carboxypeptidase-like regulatory domain-containing protein, partial [Dysgonomonas mossii]
MKKYLIFLLLTLPLYLFAQNKVAVTGKVTSAVDNEPLIGVTVVEKGSSNGVLTDLDGNYSLPNVSQGGTVVFSMIGFVSQEIKVGQGGVRNISMADDTKIL